MSLEFGCVVFQRFFRMTEYILNYVYCSVQHCGTRSSIEVFNSRLQSLTTFSSISSYFDLS